MANRSQSIIRVSQEGTEAETTEEAMYCLAPCGLLSSISYTVQDHLPKSGTTHGRLGLATSVSNQENAPPNMPTCQSGGGNLSVEIPGMSRPVQVDRN